MNTIELEEQIRLLHDAAAKAIEHPDGLLYQHFAYYVEGFTGSLIKFFDRAAHDLQNAE